MTLGRIVVTLLAQLTKTCNLLLLQSLAADNLAREPAWH